MPVLVTLYVGETDPSCHKQVAAGYPGSKMNGAPGQTVTSGPKSTPVNALKVTSITSEELHPSTVVAVTVYVPVALTVYSASFGPPCHWNAGGNPPQASLTASRVTSCPTHKVTAGPKSTGYSSSHATSTVSVASQPSTSTLTVTVPSRPINSDWENPLGLPFKVHVNTAPGLPASKVTMVLGQTV